MKVSVVTVCRNSEELISTAIKSVNAQSYPNVEHVFIDGGSTDSTLQLIRDLSQRDPRIISEPDRGIYDAMNKGLRVASGDIICFLNSDDLYIENNVLQDVVDIFSTNDTRIVWGDLVYVARDDLSNFRRLWCSKLLTKSDLFSGEIPPHPAFFITKNLAREIGFFDVNYELAADFDFMKRCLILEDFRAVHLPKILVKMRLGGATNAQFINIWRQNLEIIRSLGIVWGGPRFFLFLCKKLVLKVVEHARAVSS